MSAKGTGMMGKTIFWGFLAMAAFAALPAHARKHPPKSKSAHVLPSRVKTITLEPARKAPRMRVRPAAPTPTPSPSRDPHRFAAELREIADRNGGSFKFFKSAVRYARADFRLPADYDCDEATAEQKKAEAETAAVAECEANGASGCRIAGSLVSKNGELACGDFPGGRCPGRGYFRGCVGQALALGEKQAPSSEDLAGL